MSEVIEDMEFSTIYRTPYYCLANKFSNGSSSANSQVYYTKSELRVLTASNLSTCWQLLTKITAKNVELSLQSYLLKNGEYFVVNSNQLKKNLYRSFLKSSFESKMKVAINQEGRICFKMHTFMTKKIDFRFPKESERVKKFIQRVYMQMIEVFNVVFWKIKHIIQPEYHKVILQNRDLTQRLDIIKNACHFTYIGPSFMKQNVRQKKTNNKNLSSIFVKEDELKITNIYEMKVQSTQMDVAKFNFFSQLWQETCNLQKLEYRKIYTNFPVAKIKRMFQNNLKGLQTQTFVSKMQNHEQILSEIVIKDIQNIEWSRIYEGGFGILYKGLIPFHCCRRTNKKNNIIIHEKHMEKVVVLKVDKSSNARTMRIDIEKAILKSLKGSKSQYLPKFYETSQKISHFKDFLLSEYFPHRSLQSWLKNYGSFTSIFTKFNFLISICSGLNFLHQKNIIHRDLKLGNILVSDKMGIKITDFGQSYHSSLQVLFQEKGRDSRPGFTFPYSPPEIYINKAKLWKEAPYDMFSLGFIIFEILFGRILLTDFNEDLLKQVYKKQSQNLMYYDWDIHGRYRSLIKERLYYASQQLAYFGPEQILSPIINVIDRCLDPRVENRPHLGRVTGIIRQTYLSLLDFYSF